MTHKSSDNLHINASNQELILPVKNYEQNYTISNIGEVFSFNQRKPKGEGFRKSRFLKYKIHTNGYFYVSLYREGAVNNFLIHRLIALHFIPNPNNYPVVNHIDGNKHNNAIDNLEWCTQLHNYKHAVSHGLMMPAKGERAGLARLTEVKVLEIRRLYGNGGEITHKQIAEMFDIGHSTVGYITNRKTWKHI